MRKATDWGLQNAEVGSPVRVCEGAWEAPAIRLVTKATKTRVTLSDGSEWTRRGFRWGSSGSRRRRSADLILHLPTVENEIADILATRSLDATRRKLAKRCGREVHRLSAEECTAVTAILDAAKASEPAA